MIGFLTSCLRKLPECVNVRENLEDIISVFAILLIFSY